MAAALAGACVGPLGCGSSSEGGPSRKSPFFPQSVASFDPRPNSVMLWTRIEDPERRDQDLRVTVEVALDSSFTMLVTLDGQTTLELVAEAGFDGTVRVLVGGLEPGTLYYYRFSYTSSSGSVEASATGRTKTAPAEGADTPVRFGVICCQDYDERYYHVLRRLADEELDFVLHLGDYVYESVSAGPAPAGSRRVSFGKPEQALQLGDDGSLAARSLDNYRDLYRTYRADPDLQALHERFAMIPIWDDHEFSDDCHGDVGAYFDGRKDEADPARRAAADQAWFEYMGIDFSAVTTASFDSSKPFPENLAIFRSFVFGQHLELVMTDLRRYRPDHLVPENALPGAIFLTAAEVESVDPSLLVPYLDVDAEASRAYGEALRAGAAELDLDPASVSGPLSAIWINAMLTTLDNAEPALLDLEDPTLPRGYAYHQLLKQSQFTRVGARYMVAEGPFSALAAASFANSAGASQALMGEAQRAWFLDTLKRSQRTFKVWGSEIAFMRKRIDLSNIATLPEDLRTVINLTAEDWDGFPDERGALLGELAALDNVVVLSGDLHCFLAGTPLDPEQPERRVIEICTSSVSSTTWLEAIASIIQSTPDLPPGAALLAASVGSLLQDPTTRPNPHLAFQKLDRNGCSIIEIGADALHADLLAIDPADLRRPAAALGGSLESRFQRERFRVRTGSKELEREINGAFQTWDRESSRFR